jgi:hypothetical protein
MPVRYLRSPQVVPRTVAGELLLVPLATKTTDVTYRAADLYVLNETGALLWEALSQPTGSADMARKLMMSFDVPAEQAQADVEAFIADLLSIGAVERVEAD